MRQLQSQAEQDRDDWGAWLKWTPMDWEAVAASTEIDLVLCKSTLERLLAESPIITWGWRNDSP